MKSLRHVACFLLVLVFLGSQFTALGVFEGYVENKVLLGQTYTNAPVFSAPEEAIKGHVVAGALPGDEARAVSTLFFDNVESGDLGYSGGAGTGMDLWTIRTLGSHSSTHSWDFGNGNYADPSAGGLSFLITPDIIIPGNAVSAEFSFWHWRDFEYSSSTYWDGGNVKISTTGSGGPWTLLTPTGGYDGTVASGYSNPLAGQMVYGSSAAWENETFDLSSYVGQTINIKWDAGVDRYATTDAGWRIDDIRVTGDIPDAIQIPLSAGWNLISVPAVQTDTSIGAVLGSIDGKWQYVMAYNASDYASPWESNSPTRPDSSDDLQDIDHTMGVWLYVSSACTLSVAGAVPDATSIYLYAGWNLVGYPSLTSRSAIDTLPLDAVDKIAFENKTDPYRITDTSNLAGMTFETGHGYWVHSTFDTVWDITNTAGMPIREPAEFERMQGVLISYASSYDGLGIPYHLIAEMSENATIYTVVPSTTVRNQLINAYGDWGVIPENCQWIIAAADSYWTRDYGPWWITDESGDFNVVDFPYNRPARTNDDAIPGVVASYLGVPMDYMDVIHTGGNYMSDGLGISVSTDLVLEENTGLTEAQVRQLHKQYLNIETYHIEPDVNNEYIKHIDCWAKYLDVDKIMIRRVPSYHPQYDEIESAVANFSSYLSAYGTPYQVFRVNTTNDEPYTNCLILNNKVLVPIMNVSSTDTEAIKAYQAAMPGYEVLGIYNLSAHPWQSTDALHCRARGIPDLGMLYIRHYPVIGPEPDSEPIEIKANITAHSGSALTTYEVCWKLSTSGTYNTIPMSRVTGSQYRAFIPGQASGSTIHYYIHAADASGRSEYNPLIGSPDPHVFTVA